MDCYPATAPPPTFADLKELTTSEFARLNRTYPEIEPDLTNRLRSELTKPPAFSGRILSEDAFLNLRLLDQKESHLLTPKGEPHHLRAIINLMQAKAWNLERLKSEKLASTHDPKWFERCHDSDFDPNKTHWIALTPCRENDTSLNGPFSVFEGQHRALTFAWFLSTERISFSPRYVFVLLPRRWQFPAPEGS